MDNEMPGASKNSRARTLLGDVVRPTLTHLGLGGQAAEELVLGTAIQESLLRVRHQTHGPALGYWQMEPRTLADLSLWLNRPQLLRLWSSIAGLLRPPQTWEPHVLALNDAFACAMCRVFYLRVPEPLPAAGDITAQAAYWKHYYNTPAGKGTVDEYLTHWGEYITPATFTNDRGARSGCEP